MPMICTGEERERLATVGHFNHRASRLLRPLQQGRRALFYHEYGGTLVERFVEKVVPINVRPTQSHKECFGQHVTGIRRQMFHWTTRGTRQDASLEAIEDVHQLTKRLRHKTPPIVRAADPSQVSVLSRGPHVPAHVILATLPLIRRGAVVRGFPVAVPGLGLWLHTGSASGLVETIIANNID